MVAAHYGKRYSLEGLREKSFLTREGDIGYFHFYTPLLHYFLQIHTFAQKLMMVDYENSRISLSVFPPGVGILPSAGLFAPAGRGRFVDGCEARQCVAGVARHFS
jgi:hypothetical protein